MTEEQPVEQTEDDDTTDDVEGHEAQVRTQRPILYLDEATDSDDDNF